MSSRDQLTEPVRREGFVALMDTVRRLGGDVSVLIEGDEALAADLPRWVDFSVWKRWQCRVQDACPPGTTATDVGLQMLHAEGFKSLLRSVSLVMEPSWLYTAGYSFGARSLGAAQHLSIERQTDGRIRLTQRLPEPLELCEFFWESVGEFLRLMPTAFDYPAAIVDYSFDRAGIEAWITPPPSDTVFGRLARAFRVVFHGRQLLQDMAMQAHAYREQFNELERTVAQLRESRRRAEAALVAKQQFIAVMSHELRTPLHGVVGTVDLLSNASTERRPELEQALRGSAASLLSTMDNILHYAELDSQAPDTRERVHLDQLLTDLDAEFSGRMRAAGLAFEVDADGLPPRGVTHGEALRRTLWALVDNALKFTSSGHVIVRLAASDGRLQVSVSDTGIGVPHAQQARIFDLFTQGDQSVTRRHGGTGLGLALARRQVRAAGGRLGVESTPGQGSRFWFELPLSPEDPTVRVLPVGECCRKVLVAEDNPVNQLVLVEMLRKLGYQADTANNGQDAVDRALQERYGLILMDCEMPVMDGQTATRILRERGLQLPIVAATAYTSQSDRKQCEDAGMDAFFTKPFDLDGLDRLLKDWLPAA